MTPIQWKEAPGKPLRSTSDNDPAESGKNDLWFGVAMCLIGLIGGYVLASAL